MTIAAIVFGVGAAAEVRAGQHQAGLGAAPAPPPTMTPSRPPAPAPAPRPAPTRAQRPQGQPGVNPNAPPFPNVNTLSGPLPFGVNPPPSVGFTPPRDVFRARRGTYRPHSGLFPGFGYGGYFYGDGTAVPDTAPPQPEAPAVGLLRLDVTPGSAQVFVDGYYVGTVDDINQRRGLMLPEGPHRLEFRARGYTTDAVSVQVAANDSVTYRAALEPQQPPAPPRPPNPKAATMYVIPGCYLGNVPPRADRVGPGCDVSKARVLRPPAS